jgi:hypothetical protein
MAATSAANAAFPPSPLNSPGTEGLQPHGSPKPASAPEPPPLPLQKPIKESKSKMKLFSSKPKNIKVDNRLDGKAQALPSPGKMGIGIHSSQALNRMMMAGSTTSLVDSAVSSSSASMYSSANASTSTLVPPRMDMPCPYHQRAATPNRQILVRRSRYILSLRLLHLTTRVPLLGR